MLFNFPLRSRQSEGNSFFLCILTETQVSAGSSEIKLRECAMRGGQNYTANGFGRSFNLFSPSVDLDDKRHKSLSRC